MDASALQQLSRIQVQAIAKREKVRANGTTANIIQRLIDKHPNGVPRDEAPRPTASEDEKPPMPKLYIRIKSATQRKAEENAKIALRRSTRLVNSSDEIRRGIEEAGLMVKKTQSMLEELQDESEEIFFVSRIVEERVLKKLKTDSSLWDGSRSSKEKSKTLKNVASRPNQRDREIIQTSRRQQQEIPSAGSTGSSRKRDREGSPKEPFAPSRK